MSRNIYDTHQPQQPAPSFPPFRRIEAVLRATTDIDICSTEVIIPIPIDIPFTNCDWMFLSTTFQLTEIEGLGGYDKIEFRAVSSPGYSFEYIYIDDVEIVTRPLSVATKEMKSLKVYPNPASSVLNIDSEITFERIIITDIMGKELISLEGTDSISLGDITTGLYIMKLIKGDKIYSQRFIKE